MASKAKKKCVQLKKVLVLYVGGTIGMERNENNVYIPSPEKLFSKLAESQQMHDPFLAKQHSPDIGPNQLILPPHGNDVVVYELKEYTPLLDSSNTSSKDWIQMARDIEQNHANFDGFVILHGTDTLAYTSSALSFMLEGLQKPVILTGSQIPIFEARSDAKDNFYLSLILAGCYHIPEVCIFFGNKLFRGNRAVKISSTDLNAFDSPNYMPLAEVGIGIKLNEHLIRQPPDAQFKAHTRLDSNVRLLNIFPTITTDLIQALLKNSTGIIIQSYGIGNIPSTQTEHLQQAISQGAIIVNITQCAQGTVSPLYETGKELEEIGVLSGHDMTAEAALTKLCYVLGLPGLSRSERIEIMKQNIRGEFTQDTNNNNY